MIMIQITEEKYDCMKEKCQQMLKLGGQIMQCLDEFDDEELDERDGMRGRMNHRYRRDEYYPDYDEMNERRGVKGTGRYSRY